MRAGTELSRYSYEWTPGHRVFAETEASPAQSDGGLGVFAKAQHARWTTPPYCHERTNEEAKTELAAWRVLISNELDGEMLSRSMHGVGFGEDSHHEMMFADWMIIGFDRGDVYSWARTTPLKSTAEEVRQGLALLGHSTVGGMRSLALLWRRGRSIAPGEPMSCLLRRLVPVPPDRRFHTEPRLTGVGSDPAVRREYEAFTRSCPFSFSLQIKCANSACGNR
jgi:hypothetical protein